MYWLDVDNHFLISKLVTFCYLNNTIEHKNSSIALGIKYQNVLCEKVCSFLLDTETFHDTALPLLSIQNVVLVIRQLSRNYQTRESLIHRTTHFQCS